MDLTKSDGNIQTATDDDIIMGTPSAEHSPLGRAAVAQSSKGAPSGSGSSAPDMSAFCGDYLDFDPDDEDLLELEAVLDQEAEAHVARAPAQSSASAGAVIDLDVMMADARSAGGVINIEDDGREQAKEAEVPGDREQRSALSWVQPSQEFWLHPPAKTKPTSNPHNIHEEHFVKFMWEGYDGELVWSAGQVASMNGDSTIITLLAQMHPYEDTGIMYRNEGNITIPVPLEYLLPYDGGPESFVEDRESELGKRQRSQDGNAQQNRAPADAEDRASGTAAKQRRR